MIYSRLAVRVHCQLVTRDSGTIRFTVTHPLHENVHFSQRDVGTIVHGVFRRQTVSHLLFFGPARTIGRLARNGGLGITTVTKGISFLRKRDIRRRTLGFVVFRKVFGRRLVGRQGVLRRDYTNVGGRGTSLVGRAELSLRTNLPSEQLAPCPT